MGFSDVDRPVPDSQEGFERPRGTLEVAAIRGLQGVTADSVQASARQELLGVAGPVRTNLFGRIDDWAKRNIIAPLAQAFTGSEGDLPELTTAITDQQSKTQELWDERGRGSVFSSKNLEYVGDQTEATRMRVPFTEQVGPLIGAEIDPDGGLVLKTPGSWLIFAKVGVSGTRALGANWQRLWVEVRVRDGRLVSESWATSFAGVEQATMLDILPIVVSPEDAAVGARVSVFQDAGRHRYLLGGHGYTLLFAQKLSSTREMSTVDPGDPGEFGEEDVVPDGDGAGPGSNVEVVE